MHYVLIKDFNTFMFDNTLHHRTKYFVVIVYKLLVQKKEMKHHVKNCFEIIGRQMIKMCIM